MSLTEFICGLPKIELHLHIEGTLEPELMFALAERNGVALPYATIDELRAAYDFHNLQSFLDLYYQGMNVLKTEQDFFDLAWAYFTRCAQDNLRHVEFFFDPQAHLERGVGLDVQFAGLNRACNEAEKELSITSSIILSFLRDMTEDSALATLEAALPYREHFIGVGLDSAEVGNPPEKFVRVFERARAEGFHAVAHAGEEGPADYIQQALDLLKIERIDHGVRCVEDDALMKRVAEEHIPLTVCPLSNLYLKVIDRMEDHTLPQLLAAGLKVTLNSDDPAYFGGYMNDNFLAVQKAFSLSREQWVTLTRNAIDATFASAARQQALHDELNAYIAAA
ncbi:adenosine deaminase [Zymobacter palmae]|uniref:Adenine deaminase n=1 Tax=Zymobacter palmae TaxID=33074 RepID=A0A348HFR6_9GAMM|nr:adenosine deaminase [Zymobacter palmae]BBG30468.1 adenosine deaminase [Zymobacter palmae]